MDPQNPNTTENERRAQNKETLELQLPQHLRGKIPFESWNSLTYEQKDILTNIDKLPEKLLGVVPESVWETLDLNHKIEFLFTNGVLQKETFQVDLSSTEAGFEQFKEQLGGEGSEVEQSVEAEGDFKRTESEKEFEKLKSEVREIGETEKNEPTKNDLPPDDVERIKQESGYTFSSDSMPTFAGYQPDDSFLQQVNVHAEGSPKKATTWTANIIQKFWKSISS